MKKGFSYQTWPHTLNLQVTKQTLQTWPHTLWKVNELSRHFQLLDCIKGFSYPFSYWFNKDNIFFFFCFQILVQLIINFEFAKISFHFVEINLFFFLLILSCQHMCVYNDIAIIFIYRIIINLRLVCHQTLHVSWNVERYMVNGLEFSFGFHWRCRLLFTIYRWC